MRGFAAALLVAALVAVALVAAGCGGSSKTTRSTAANPPATTPLPATPARRRIPPLLDRTDVYAAGRPGLLSPVVRDDPARVYVPNSKSDTVDVISQRTARIVGHFATGGLPQHVTPSWDLKTLWVTNDTGNTLTPINPRTGRPGRQVPVTDPYNLYFTADGARAIVVAERNRDLDFRTPHTMKLRHRLALPQCAGVDHMDYTADGRLALVSCEFAGRMEVVDLRRERAIKGFALRAGAMPQDVKLSPDGRTFYVADMASGGVWLVDAHTMRKIRFQPTGSGAHGLYPSRDSRHLFVSNRGEGSISVISFATRRPIAKWHIPGGGSPDMGGVSADGRVLWLSGRYDAVVYAISTRTGRLLHRIRVGQGPQGWPSGRSPGATRSATRASCAEPPGRSAPPRELVQRVAAQRQPLDERQRVAPVGEVGRRLDQQAPHPARGGTVEAGIPALGEQAEDRERVVEPDPRQVTSGRLDELQVGGLQGPLESRIRVPLTCHERMFAGRDAPRRRRVARSPPPNAGAAACATTLAAGATCRVGVTFTPAAAGTLTGSLVFNDNSGSVTGSP